MAQGPQTRCAGCRRFIQQRADHDDYSAEERAYTADRMEEHDCSMDWAGSSAWAPRDGEELAYLAQYGDQFEDADTFEGEPFELQPAAAAAITVNPTPAWMEGAAHEQRHHLPVVQRTGPASVRPRGGRVADHPRRLPSSVQPAAYAGGGDQLDLTGYWPARPSRQRDRVQPAAYPAAPSFPSHRGQQLGLPVTVPRQYHSKAWAGTVTEAPLDWPMHWTTRED